jgi:hypothetical protein
MFSPILTTKSSVCQGEINALNISPGPAGHFLLGNYSQMQAGMVSFLRALQSYGDIVHYLLTPLPFVAFFGSNTR